jgi:hypothetical protein
LKLQLHKYSADTFRNNPWIILICEREERERDSERASATRKRLDTDARIFRAHVHKRPLSHTIKRTLTPPKHTEV